FFSFYSLQSQPSFSLFPYTTLFRSREGGGIGRRAGFRFQWGNSCEGSSPSLRTESIPGVALRARAAPPLERLEPAWLGARLRGRSEEHTSELQSRENLVCRLLLEKK